MYILLPALKLPKFCHAPVIIVSSIVNEIAKRSMLSGSNPSLELKIHFIFVQLFRGCCDSHLVYVSQVIVPKGHGFESILGLKSLLMV